MKGGAAAAAAAPIKVVVYYAQDYLFGSPLSYLYWLILSLENSLLCAYLSRSSFYFRDTHNSNYSNWKCAPFFLLFLDRSRARDIHLALYIWNKVASRLGTFQMDGWVGGGLLDTFWWISTYQYRSSTSKEEREGDAQAAACVQQNSLSKILIPLCAHREEEDCGMWIDWFHLFTSATVSIIHTAVSFRLKSAEKTLHPIPTSCWLLYQLSLAADTLFFFFFLNRWPNKFFLISYQDNDVFRYINLGKGYIYIMGSSPVMKWSVFRVGWKV